MKRYLLAFAALVFVAASAYSVDQKKEPASTSYYFYEVVGGQINPNAPLNTQPMTVAEFESADLVDCPQGNVLDCVRAWIDPDDATATGTADHVIKRAQ